MTPDEVLRPFLKEYDLPESLVRLLYLLFRKEIEDGFPSFTPDDAESSAKAFAMGLLYLLKRLPPTIYETGSFKASLRDLASLTEEDELKYSALRSRTREMGQHERRRADIQGNIDAIQSALDAYIGPRAPEVNQARTRIRELKDELKGVKPPDLTPEVPEFWRRVFDFRVGFNIPERTRFEHTHILGTPGSGKTVLLHNLIYEDILTDAAVIVMAPKSQLIPNFARLASINPERLIVVSPDSPVGVNIFDLGFGESGEEATNQTVDLLNYVFGSLVKAEISGKQAALLNYCIRLLILVPGATLKTLYRLLEQQTVPKGYDEYVARMNESGRTFFEKRFCDHSKQGYGDTKKELFWRLDALFAANTFVEKTLCEPSTEVNIRKVMEEGKVLLIDTSSKKLGDGSSLLGRFFIGLVTLAAEQRDTGKRLRPVYFYIDEAHDYVTSYLTRLLDKGREAKVGLTLAHQNLKQLAEISAQLEHSVHNTSIKFVGRCNDADASKMAGQLRVEAEHIQFQDPFHFRLYVSGFNKRSLPIKTKAGLVESLPKRGLLPPRDPSSVVHIVHTVRQSGNVQKKDREGEGAW